MAAPAAIASPPKVSEEAAARALVRAGARPSLSIIPVAPSSPGPSNQPRSFWVPWAKNMPPMSEAGEQTVRTSSGTSGEEKIGKLLTGKLSAWQQVSTRQGPSPHIGCVSPADQRSCRSA